MVGDWSVTTLVAPPEGFVSDYDSLSAEVTTEIESVQFTITEVASKLTPTETTFDVTHKGKKEKMKSKVGIFLTPEYARSRGVNVASFLERMTESHDNQINCLHCHDDGAGIVLPEETNP